MSLLRIRCLVRIAAAVIGALLFTYGVALAVDAQADRPIVMRILTLLLLIAVGWGVIETVVAGFEMIARTSGERYERLERQQADAYTIAGQAVCETLRVMSEKAVEDCPNVSVLHR